MFHCKRFAVNPLEENCYILSDDTHQGVIIDCGAWHQGEQQEIANYIKDEGITLVKVLQTHMHFDHTFGLPFLHSTFHLGPWCHSLDLETYEGAPAMVEHLFRSRVPFPMVPAEGFLCDGDEVKFGDTTLCVIHTPGHTPGGVSFYCEKEAAVFSGDTIFRGSYGRTDFPGGSLEQEIQSIRTRLLTLPDQTIIYPGHGPSTTVKEEKSLYLMEH